MNIRQSRPTNYTPYELVFGQHLLRHFNMIEEWKTNNINMEEDLPENIIENEECSESEDDDLYYVNKNFHTTSPSSWSLILFSDTIQEEKSNIEENSSSLTNGCSIVTFLPSFSQSLVSFSNTTQQENSNFNKDKSVIEKHKLDNQQDIQIINFQTCVAMNDCAILQKTTIDSQQQIQQTISENAEIVGEQTISIQDNIVNQITAKGKAIQEASNNPTSQYNIYCNIANRNLENYRSKMKHQMYTKYKIHKHTYEFGDLVKIQIDKIDHDSGDRSALPCKIYEVLPRNMYRLICQFGILNKVFSASVILPLGPKEFPELDNPPINLTVSIIEAARLQSNALADNIVCNCKENCLIAKCACRKVNTLCGSGCHLKNSKCQHKA
ncbi:15071_t:CDS:2 [Cetraspora pellucida]|uniref:15071_t:CDS:1 n=1 Tax=Cetraspora pellucida TaxID=1433469 RepID=A0ACA9K2G5_9GLOM|nr:15071_t:CDS:2 [Cetraspora pellucida]